MLGELNNTTQEFDTEKQKNVTLTEQITALRAQLQQDKNLHQVALMKAEEERQKTTAKLQAELAETTQTYKQASDRAEQAVATVTSQQNAIYSLQEQLGSAREEHELEQERLQSELATAIQALERADARIFAANSEIERLQEELSANKVTLAGQARNAELEEQIAVLQGKVSKAQDNRQEAVETISASPLIQRMGRQFTEIPSSPTIQMIGEVDVSSECSDLNENDESYIDALLATQPANGQAQLLHTQDDNDDDDSCSESSDLLAQLDMLEPLSGKENTSDATAVTLITGGVSVQQPSTDYREILEELGCDYNTALQQAKASAQARVNSFVRGIDSAVTSSLGDSKVAAWLAIRTSPSPTKTRRMSPRVALLAAQQQTGGNSPVCTPGGI